MSHTIAGEDTALRLSTVDDMTLARLARQLTRAAQDAAHLPPDRDTERLTHLAALARHERTRRRARRRVADALAEVDRVIGGDGR